MAVMITPQATLSPEVRALIWACEIQPPFFSAPGPTRFTDELDAALFLRLADYHRVSSLAYRYRSRFNFPDGILDVLRSRMMATLHRNLQFAAELKQALKALQAANVDVILLKGVYLM